MVADCSIKISKYCDKLQMYIKPAYLQLSSVMFFRLSYNLYVIVHISQNNGLEIFDPSFWDKKNLLESVITRAGSPTKRKVLCCNIDQPQYLA